MPQALPAIGAGFAALGSFAITAGTAALSFASSPLGIPLVIAADRRLIREDAKP
jgi:hypothetical protein